MMYNVDGRNGSFVDLTRKVICLQVLWTEVWQSGIKYSSFLLTFFLHTDVNIGFSPAMYAVNEGDTVSATVAVSAGSLERTVIVTVQIMSEDVIGRQLGGGRGEERWWRRIW